MLSIVLLNTFIKLTTTAYFIHIVVDEYSTIYTDITIKSSKNFDVFHTFKEQFNYYIIIINGKRIKTTLVQNRLIKKNPFIYEYLNECINS